MGISRWVLTGPAGIGSASLRAGIKLCLGFSPFASGVYSAGNAPALRSTIIGVFLYAKPELREKYVRLSTQATHTDPKATIGALALANLFAELVRDATNSETKTRPSLERLLKILSEPGEQDAQWRRVLTFFAESVKNEESVAEFAKKIDCEKGITGFIYYTVAAAVFSWFVNYGDPAKPLRDVVLCGGDTDTTAAIAGALAGCCQYGAVDFPSKWRTRICDFPCSLAYLEKLGKALSQTDAPKPIFYRAFWPIRNLFFFVVVLGHVVLRTFFFAFDAITQTFFRPTKPNNVK